MAESHASGGSRLIAVTEHTYRTGAEYAIKVTRILDDKRRLIELHRPLAACCAFRKILKGPRNSANYCAKFLSSASATS